MWSKDIDLSNMDETYSRSYVHGVSIFWSVILWNRTACSFFSFVLTSHILKNVSMEFWKIQYLLRSFAPILPLIEVFNI